MSRNKALAALQKAYDESYLSCSTAVYHESQGNELESMRHWRSALEHIHEHNANKTSPSTSSRSDTEKALVDALKQLELQCKERIDLLEALRVSRQEGLESTSSRREPKEANSRESPSTRLRGSIGQGTIPAVTYSELSRPALPPRPQPASRKSSDPNIRTYSSHGKNTTAIEEARPSPSESPLLSSIEDRSRGPSPDKHTMRTTLRSGRPGDKPAKSSRKTVKPAGEGPSKAATLAWSALSTRDRSVQGSPSTGPSAVQQPAPRRSVEQPRIPGASPLQWDSHSRRLVKSRDKGSITGDGEAPRLARHSDEYASSRPSLLSVSAASSALNSSSAYELPSTDHGSHRTERHHESRLIGQSSEQTLGATYSEPQSDVGAGSEGLRLPSKKNPGETPVRRKPVVKSSGESPRNSRSSSDHNERANRRGRQKSSQAPMMSSSEDDSPPHITPTLSKRSMSSAAVKSSSLESFDTSLDDETPTDNMSWAKKKASILKNLPAGVDDAAAKQILNDIVVKGDEVRWGDIAGLEIAKNALREAVVYPFLRPDLFMGLREPARGMLLFGPPGTGKTMLARAVATESRSTFFSISASSLTSKFLGESEKLVRALFGLARSLSPSIIFVDEIDSLLSQRSGSGEHEATRRIKTEFLIQWSDLQRAAAGREVSEKDHERGDANRVLVLAATNLPWAIDEAARRRFVRRQYIPLPESTTRETQLRTLLGQQKHDLSDADIQTLVKLTDGFSGSDITALAKDAAMGPLRSLGEALLHMTMDDIRPIMLLDFEASLSAIRPSVSKAGLKEYEDWAREFGERGG